MLAATDRATLALSAFSAMHARDITAAMAARLVATQFPQWARLQVRPVALGGSDNRTFRLGDDMSVRLPSGDPYVAQVDKEQRWLPVLAPQLPVAIPEPLARGEADDIFPRPWSVYRWLDGTPANADDVLDQRSFGAALASFLGALQNVDASDGPRAGAHNFHRGGPLTTYDAETRACIGALDAEIDGAAALALWERALTSSWEGPGVWVHGDLTPSNLLVSQGALSAVIDFGCSGVGDPACDLVIAWTFLTDAGHRAFRDGLRLDDATWARGRGWALWKALITLARARRLGTSDASDTRRFGWRTDCLGVIDAVLADDPG